jgi:curved DNA-binding protein CbpA
MINYYKILGLEDGASLSEIEASYNKLSKDLDPANNDNQEFFVEEFKLLKEAYKALTGKEPEELKEADINTSDISDVFDDSDTLVSILKIFKQSKDPKKAEIIESLEAFKSGNLIYQQALELLYKKEGVSSIKSYMDKQSISKDPSSQNAVEPSETNIDNASQNINSPLKQPQKDHKKPRNKIYVFILLLLVGLGTSYLFFLNKVADFESLILPTIERNVLVNKDAEKNKWESKFRKDYPRLKSYYIDAKSNEDEKLNFDDAIVKTDTIISFLFFSKKFSFKSLDSDYFECAYYHEINRYNKKYNKEFISWFKKTKRKYKLKESKLNELIRFVKNNPLNASFPFNNIENDVDTNCVKCISNYISSIELNQDAITDFDNFVKSYLKEDQLARTFSAQSFINFMDDLEKLEDNMSKSTKKALNKKASKSKPNAITLFEIDGNSPKKYPFLYKTKSQYKFNDLEVLGEINYSLNKQHYKKSVLEKLVDDLKKQIDESYKTNSLYTGAQPYSYCYGKNPYCSIPDGYAECSFIDVQASSNSDVIVIIKKNNKVYSHAYIKAGGYYKFKLGNGMFQTFFYYGKGWNPDKYMKKSICGDVTGGFVSNESLDKSDPNYLNHSSISYTLYAVKDGNFNAKPSNKNEAF